MEHFKANVIANFILGAIAPLCKSSDENRFEPMITIAGSIRRQKADVKDIEIVCIPAPGNRYKLGMYFNNQGHYIVKGNFHGRYVQMVLKDKGIKLDLFMPQEADYYRMLAIRTGPDDYSHKTLAIAWRNLGWVGTDDGLRRERQCGQKGKTWVCAAMQPELPPVWQSEREFIEWLKLPYLEPKERK
jgi:DNA polymerase/3'-5' exonuclease PolX